MKRIATSFLIVVLCAVCFPYLFVHAQNQNQQVPPKLARPDKDLAQLVRKHERVRLNPSQVAQRVRLTGRLSLKLAEQSFELDLQPNDMRAKRYRAEETGEDGIRRAIENAPARTYKGAVQGQPDTQARFTIDESGLEGMIITSEDRYYIEPLNKYTPSAESTEFVFYKRSDVVKDPTEMCGVTMDEMVGDAVQGVAPQIAEQLAAETVAPTLREVELATEADYEYVMAVGGSAAADAEIMSIMNQVEGVYERELGITFSIVYQHTWSAQGTSYPYTSTVIGREVLQQFTDHWNARFTNVRRDVAHMWTGKDIVIDSNTPGLIGIAWVGVVCRNPSSSYGVSQRLGSVTEKYVLTAHEIGHNFGGKHSEMQTFPFAVDVGDFNHDGKQDLAVAAHDGSHPTGTNRIHTVKIMLGDGIGGFGAATDYAMGANSRPQDVVVGDFNRDGKQDLAVSLGTANRVAIMLGNGLGGFSAPTKFVVGQGPQQVVISDLNADHKLDLVVPNSATHNVSVLFGDGLGGFGPTKNYAMGVTTWEPNSVAIGDFNGDSKPDLAVPIANSLAIMVNSCK